MKLAWDRAGVITMTVKVEELAALMAGARVAAGALANQPGEQTAELSRVLASFDRAGAALQPLGADQGKGADADWYNPASRDLQDRFGTRRLADRIAQVHLHDHLDAGDRAFVERADLFFLATADRQGKLSCSYKGGDPGFVRVLDDRTIAFPSYDGNGMYLSGGNVVANPEVGLLFLDLERAHRMRANGTASIDPEDPLLAEYPGAEFIMRIALREVFPNCPRYIHKYKLVSRSGFVPRQGCVTPEPDWKAAPWAADVVPSRSGQPVRGGA